jgi:hypothetical protein
MVVVNWSLGMPIDYPLKNLCNLGILRILYYTGCITNGTYYLHNMILCWNTSKKL